MDLRVDIFHQFPASDEQKRRLRDFGASYDGKTYTWYRWVSADQLSISELNSLLEIAVHATHVKILSKDDIAEQ